MSKKKIFVISDIHGYYDEMIEALNKAGFDKNNSSHLLISCGDNLDRGSKPKEVIEYLTSVKNKVLIYGNHESLFTDMCFRRYPAWNDYSNGTFQTMLDLNEVNSDEIRADLIEPMFDIAYHMYKPLMTEMLDFYETKNYIFVHSWIPIGQADLSLNKELYEEALRGKYKGYYSNVYDNNWRDADPNAWEEARWGNPFANALEGLNQTDKTIVFGHWHTSWYWNSKQVCSEFGDDAKFDIVKDDELKIIGIDACTAFSKQMNVLVLEDELC